MPIPVRFNGKEVHPLALKPFAGDALALGDIEDIVKAGSADEVAAVLQSAGLEAMADQGAAVLKASSAYARLSPDEAKLWGRFFTTQTLIASYANPDLPPEGIAILVKANTLQSFTRIEAWQDPVSRELLVVGVVGEGHRVVRFKILQWHPGNRVTELDDLREQAKRQDRKQKRRFRPFQSKATRRPALRPVAICLGLTIMMAVLLVSGLPWWVYLLAILPIAAGASFVRDTRTMNGQRIMMSLLSALGVMSAVTSVVNFVQWNTMDHTTDTVICRAYQADHQWGAEGRAYKIMTPAGKFTLDPGWYLNAYYPQPSAAVKVLHTNMSVHITWHGHVSSSPSNGAAAPYATRIDLSPAAHGTCG